MKKLLSVLTLGFTLMLGLSLLTIQAEPEEPDLIEVYPYDNLDCSLGNDQCGFTKVGRDNWTIIYNGYRYWVVGNNTRYVSDFEDKDSDGLYDPMKGEYEKPAYNAFGMLVVNNTDTLAKLSSDLTRKELNGEINRIWSYFDEEGVLQILEDQIHTIHMVNDNHGVEGESADWRIATEVEKEAYEAAATDEKPADMLNTHYRIKRVPVEDDADGYIMEPLKYIQWVHTGYDADDDTTVESTIFDYDPREVHVPAGWKVLSFGTLDRGAYKPALDMVLSLPYTFLEETAPKMVPEFVEVPPALNGFAALDKNPYVDGIQVVADFGEPFVLNDAGLSATWVKMFDDEGKIINKTGDRLDFELELAQNDVVLETVKYTWDADANKYNKDGAFTKVDTDTFEAMYDLTMRASTPKEKHAEAKATVVVGVLPNRFEGHQTHYYRDGEYIDLMAGIKAYNGNGVDITKDVVVSWSEGFNPYNPQPGKYTITLDVAHEYHWEPILTDDAQTGFKLTFTNVSDPENPDVRGTNVIRYPSKYNVHFNKEASPQLTYIDYEHRELVAQTAGLGWGSVAGVVKNGKLVHNWNGFTAYTETFPDGSTVAHPDAVAMQNAIREYQLQEDEYMILAHGGDEGGNIRYGWGDEVLLEGRPDVHYTAEAQVTYELNVDDRTAPQARVVNPVYKVDNTMFDDVDEAILANVVAFDNYSEVDMFVDDDGGLDLDVPGVYNVKVDVEDLEGNSTSVSFTVEVVKARLSEEEVGNLLEEQKTELQGVINDQKALIEAQQAELAAQQAELEALNATNRANQNQINDLTARIDANQAAIDQKPNSAGAPIWLVILFTVIGAGAAFGASFLLFGRKK